MTFCTLATSTFVLLLFPAALAVPLQPPIDLVSRQYSEQDLYANWPSYSDLPLHPSFPTKAAWGVWGADDELGALNHITPLTVAAARSEIQEGTTINLNLPLDAPNPPLFPVRQPLVHSFIAHEGWNDDIVTLDTQISTQIDGLRHFPYSTNADTSTYQFYNELITFQDLMSAGGIRTLGIHNAADKGIAGRGVLLDWAGWMDSKNSTFNPASDELVITASDLDAVALWQGLDPANFTRPGDFLVVRTGFTRYYRSLPIYEQNILPFRLDNAYLGVDASDATLEWLWGKKLSMVGADNAGFETSLMKATIDGTPGRSLHQVFISGWGQSIVELLDLEKLAENCHRLHRFTFFFTLETLNVVGGVASPPNAIAIM